MTPCRSASSAATAHTRQTKPAATPTSSSPSARASTTARLLPGCRAIPGISPRPSSSMPTSIPTNLAATIRPTSEFLPMHGRSCASCLPRSKRRGAKRDATKAWIADIKGWQADWEKFVRPNFEIHASPIRPERIVADCQAVMPPDAILCCDVGVNHNWYMQFWKPQTSPATCSTPGVSPAWALAPPARSAPSLRHRKGRSSRSPAMDASPWCRTCFALRSNTIFPWCG